METEQFRRSDIEAKKLNVAKGLVLATTSIVGPERYLGWNRTISIVDRTGEVRDANITTCALNSLQRNRLMLPLTDRGGLITGYKVNPDVPEAVEKSEALVIPTFTGEIGRTVLADIVEQALLVEAGEDKLNHLIRNFLQSQ